MAVPEAAVHENGLPPAREHQIRGSGEVTPVEPKSVPRTMKEAAERAFGLGVTCPNPSHERAALRRGKPIHHYDLHRSA